MDSISPVTRRVLTAVGVGALLLLISAATVHLSLHFTVSQYSGPKATYTVAGFTRQYGSGVYAYRPLARELLLWLNQTLFDGRNLYEARVLLNGMALLALNGALVVWTRRMGARWRDALVGVVLASALVGLSLYVRSNPYTVLVLAYIAVGLFFAERRWCVPMIVLAGLGPALHGMTAVAVVAFVARMHLLEGARRPELVATRAALLRTAPVVAVWVAGYVSLRAFIESDGVVGGVFDSVTTAANLGASPLLVAGFALGVVGILAARAWRAGRLWRPDLVAVCALAVPFAILMLFFGRLVELRLFLPFVVVAIGLGIGADAQGVGTGTGAGPDGAQAPAGDTATNGIG